MHIELTPTSLLTYFLIGLVLSFGWHLAAWVTGKVLR